MILHKTKIAFIGTQKAYNQFVYDLVGPLTIEFILVDRHDKIMGVIFDGFITHYSARDLSFSDRDLISKGILSRIKSRP